MTGMSGAGKSTALKMMEDMGFFCIDNLPIPLLDKLVDFATNFDTQMKNVAIGIDARSGENLDKVQDMLEILKSKDVQYEVLFLDAEDAVLVKRYKETRRSHPLAQGERVDKGIMRERQKMEFLKKEEMPTKVIVVSCQEEFDVVKKAMKLGAYDYLRKLNLSSDELENILEKCLVETEERITVHMQGIREIRYEEIMRDSRDIFAGTCNYQTLICILAKDTEELSRVTEIIHKWAETELREGLQIQKGNQYGYFLLEEKPEKSVYMELKKRAERKTDRELYMGIFEGCMEKTADIVRAAAMAEQIQLFSYYDKEEKLVFFQKKIETEGHSPRGMHGYLDSLKEKIRSFDREKTEQELHGIFGLIRQESYISINVLRRNFMDILGIYSMVAQSLNGALEEIELDGDNCHYQKIMMMESLREIEKWFLKFNNIFMEKFWIAYKCSRSEILQKVVKYIEVHIMEPIHLSDAAAETGVSSAYLSTMFKKEMGYNFIEYVNLRKIELARQMLQDGKMVYEVSELLGFENSTYFSRVFKRYTDVSPDTYRKQM